MRGRPHPPADAILTADWHLREDTPTCRTDDFWGAQFDKLAQLAELQRKNNNCPILVAGDVFHHWKPSPALLRAVIDALRDFPGSVICVPGQHDLPQHSLAEYPKSGLAVLEAAGMVTVLRDPDIVELPFPSGFRPIVGVVGFPFGEKLGPISPLQPRNVAIIHHLVYRDQPLFPGAEATGSTAKAILKQMAGFDLVASGDNHQTFVWPDGSGLGKYTSAEQLLVNPGPLTRQTAATAGHRPCVFLWWARENKVQRHVLTYNQGAVSREHLEAVEERDERMEAFVRRLQDGHEVSLSFEDNLRRALAVTPVRKPVEELIWTFVEKEKK